MGWRRIVSDSVVSVEAGFERLLGLDARGSAPRLEDSRFSRLTEHLREIKCALSPPQISMTRILECRKRIIWCIIQELRAERSSVNLTLKSSSTCKSHVDFLDLLPD